MPEGKRGLRSSEAGFSLIELLCAMSVTLAVASIASTLLASSLNIRTHENARTDSIADVQRALNTMAREIAIGGYGFDANSNGIVVGDSDASSVRVRSNLDRYSPAATDATRYSTTERNEDIKYFIDQTNGQNFLVRYDNNAPVGSQSTVLANRVDSLNVVYWSPANTPLDPSQAANAVGLRITVNVNLPAVGTPGSPGYQPPTTIDLSSDVALRNKQENLSTY
jgi:prepilin-type N-terminal cleavage/methylation domain-containing protein